MKEIISQFEKETGKVLYDKSELPSTREEFDALTEDHTKWHGVMYEDRVKFLQANDYEITRENLINPNLSAKPPKEEIDG